MVGFLKEKKREWGKVYAKVLKAVKIPWNARVKIIVDTDLPN